jgi:hypothetical protein
LNVRPTQAACHSPTERGTTMVWHTQSYYHHEPLYVGVGKEAYNIISFTESPSQLATE